MATSSVAIRAKTDVLGMITLVLAANKGSLECLKYLADVLGRK